MVLQMFQRFEQFCSTEAGLHRTGHGFGGLGRRFIVDCRDGFVFEENIEI